MLEDEYALFAVFKQIIKFESFIYTIDYILLTPHVVEAFHIYTV